jgi:hypothetical protein
MTKRKQHLELVRTDEELEEEAFYALVDDSGFMLPHAFRDWKKFFVSRASFLKEATRWIKFEFDGVHVRVITDIECGRGSYNQRLIKNGQVSSEEAMLQDQDEAEFYGYGDDYEWMRPTQPQQKQWVKGQGYTYPKNYWGNGTLFSKSLPLEPAIKAPEGVSGKNLVVL